MLGLFDKLIALTRGASAEVGTLRGASVTEAIDGLRTRINAGPDHIVRLYVDSGGGRGQQAAGVRVLNRIVAPATDVVPGLAFTGETPGGLRKEVQILCAEAPSTIVNLRQLLGWEADAVNGTYRGVWVTLTEWIRRADLDPTCDFGFSGASDNDDGSPASLNVRHYLRFQPFLYHKPDLIAFRDERPAVDLGAVPALGGASFKQRGFHLPVAPEPFDWDPYVGSDNPVLRNKAEVLRWLLANMAGGGVTRYRLLVTYSIHTASAGPNAMGAWAYEQVFELMTGVMATQFNRAGSVPSALPAVIVNLDEIAPDPGADAPADDPLFPVKMYLGGFPTPLEQTLLGSAVPGNALAAKTVWTNRGTYLKRLGAQDRYQFNTAPTSDSVAASVDGWLLAGTVPVPSARRVLWVQLGPPLPVELFNYVISRSTLPPVFEGVNTANLALNFGTPYYHVNRPRTAGILYPTRVLAAKPADKLLTGLQDAADQIPVQLKDWPSDVEFASYPPERFAAPIISYLAESPGGPLHKYFADLGDFYRDPANDKLSLALAYLAQITAPQNDQLQLAASAVEASGNSLEDVYTLLEEHFDPARKTLDVLPGGLPPGAIAGALRSLVGPDWTLIQASLARLPAGGAISSIAASGQADLFGIPSTAALRFSAPQAALQLEVSWSFPVSGYFPGLDWIELGAPSLELTLSETGGFAFGDLGADVRIGPETIRLNWALPTPEDQWLITADVGGDHPPSLSDAFQLAAGTNLATALPPPLNAISKLALARIEVGYDPTAKTASRVTLVVRSADDQPVPLVGNVALQNISITTTIQDPAGAPAVFVDVAASFQIGSAPDPAVIAVGASMPRFVFNGQLVSGTIGIVELLAAFVVTTPLELPHDPTITAFSFAYEQATSTSSVTVALGIGWPFEVAGATIFTIDTLGLALTMAGGGYFANLQGTIVLLPKSKSPLHLTVGADYAGEAAGWTFSVQQTDDGVSLSALLEEYFGWRLAADYAIAGLGLTASTGDGSWVFTGRTAEPWQVPFIDVGIGASLRAGYNGAKQVAAAHPAISSSSLATVLDANPAPGYFARLELKLEWQQIEITVWYDYNPAAQSFGITWGLLEGKVTGPDSQTGDWVASLGFANDVTLGSMIEDMVSWVTGSRFALDAPWSVLNQVKLSGLTLTYTFNKTDATRNKVGFKVAIGPIELGFARIDSVEVTYQSTGADRGVQVTLKGSFPWNVGDGAAGDSGSLGPWDASKPGQAPAPPGQGGKYLDLRLLSLGQHVTIPGITEANTIAAVMDKISDLPEPKPGEVPAIVYDPSSNWLVGSDLGFLRAGDESSTTYLLTLQVVFNDPHLYGLRIKLDGPAAKVLKGLDFQIMYRQLTDTLGVYQGEITLPDAMRHLSVGAYTLTLPVFAIAIYTNGDFLVDVGFPHNYDFSRSLTIEGIVYPGIPITGSAGFYFGELPAAATDRVPAADNGTFNPIIVFGFGLQIGVGKSVQYGPLKAGFSLTLVGIIEGVIAKWNPYADEPGAGSQELAAGANQGQLQGSYYFWLQGTVGISGRLYGSVDFAIVKAEVNVALALYIQLTYISCESLAISVIASIDVAVTVKIDLWLCSIKLHFSFSMRLKETFTLLNDVPPPWHVPAPASGGLLRAPVEARLRAARAARPRALGAAAGGGAHDWSRLAPEQVPTALRGFLVSGLAAAHDEWRPLGELASQVPCYVSLLALESVLPAGQDGEANVAKAFADAPDSSFELLCKRVLGWAVAAVLPAGGPITWSDLQATPVSDVELTTLLNDVLISTDASPTPWENSQIETFLGDQFKLAVTVPAADAAANATIFPMPPGLALTAAASGMLPALDYSFGAFNAIDAAGLATIRREFAELLVQVQREAAGGHPPQTLAPRADRPSVGSWIFGDYFLLLARQMVQAARDGLRSFAYPLSAGPTPYDAVRYLADRGASVALHDVLCANPAAPLAALAGNAVTLGLTVSPGPDRDFASLAAGFAGVSPVDLALTNAASAILTPGAAITYPGQPPYTLPAGATLGDVARYFIVPLGTLVGTTGILDQRGLLDEHATLVVPLTTYQAANGDTLEAIATAGAYAGLFSGRQLAVVNAGRQVLRAGSKLSYPGRPDQVVAAGACLLDVAAGFEVTLAELLDIGGVLSTPALIAPLAVLALPPFAHQVLADDTLAKVAARYATTVEVVAEAPQNGSLKFAADGPAATLAVPHLTELRLGALIAEAQASNALAHLAGMASRYNLHGLRLPTAGIEPRALGIWVRDESGTLRLPPQAGLFALSGQQVQVPVVASGEVYTFSFDRTNAGEWLVFEDPAGTLVERLDITIAGGSRAAGAISALATWVVNNRLEIATEQLGPEQMASVVPATYPFSSALPWQASAPIRLPFGPPPVGVAPPRIWSVPDALLALPDPATRRVNPRVSLTLDRYDEASGATVSVDAGAHGWATTIELAIKRVPPVPGSPASLTTYELLGAPGKDILLLERLLDQLGGDDGAFAQIAVAYAPDPSGGSADGLQTDPLDQVTLGIAQVNLSTQTRPPAALAQARVGADPLVGRLLNRASEFLRLVWEASITRSGGFYLYYYDAADKRGLPDRIFDDRGEATVTVVAIYAQQGAGFGPDDVANYMNGLVTTGAIETGTVLIARAKPPVGLSTPTGGTVSLSGLAGGWFCDLGDLAAANAALRLRPGVALSVTQGVFRAPLGGIPIAALAARFNTTVAALAAANPRLGAQLPETLVYPLAIRLPVLELQGASSPDTASLGALALACGAGLPSIAHDLADVAGLFADDQSVKLPGGPVVRSATVPPGAAAFGTRRAVPGAVPSDPGAKTFPPLFLGQAYSLLGIQIAANADFDASPTGLPAGPTYDRGEADGDRDGSTPNTKALVAGGDDEPWTYAMSVPYNSFAKPPLAGDGHTPGPYDGVGGILQIDFAWQDQFGNRIATDLSAPQNGGRGPTNMPPLLAGYSDALVALSQWPSSAASWQVANAAAPAIELTIGFSTARYDGVISAHASDAGTVAVKFTQPVDTIAAADPSHYVLSDLVTVTGATPQADGVTVTLKVSPALSTEHAYALTVSPIPARTGDASLSGQAGFAYPDDPDQRTSTVMQSAAQDLGLYTQLWLALTDPQGVALALATTLVAPAADGGMGRVPLPPAAADALRRWLAGPAAQGSVTGFLADRAAAGNAAPPPLESLVLAVPLAPGSLTSAEIFVLAVSFVITRTGGSVLDDLATVAAIREVSTPVAPRQQALPTAGDGSGTGTLGLTAFAESFEDALSVAGVRRFKVATGVDRAQTTPTSTGNAVWAVRLGLESGQPIRFAINPTSAPATIFAPRPAANKLITRDLPIRTYKTGSGLGSTAADTHFAGIDLDVWCRMLFAAVDAVLSPQLTAPIQLLGSLVGRDYLATLLGQKELLAGQAAAWMIPAFADQAGADASQAVEAFRQQLLSLLSNAYATRAAVELTADVTADVVDPLADEPPRLFGAVVPAPAFLSATVAAETLDTVKLYFSVPLDPAVAGLTSNYTLSGDLDLRSATLGTDGTSVTLAASANVQPGTTTASVSTALVTATRQPLLPPLRHTIAIAAPADQPSTITLSSPKLMLKTAPARSLTFLVTAPEVTRGAEGEVVPSLSLDLVFQGSSIEHQIGSLSGIEGYRPSSWLTFVTPDGLDTLSAWLGATEVPLPLRAFPAGPSLTLQVGVGDPIGPDDPLVKLTHWTYELTYQLPFHYPQDEVHGIVEFNLRAQPAALSAIEDAVPQIAQFVSSIGAVSRDLEGIVATIDATTTQDGDAERIHDAKVTLDTLTTMIDEIVRAGGSSLGAAAAPAAMAGAPDLTYEFVLTEGTVSVDGTDSVLLVTLSGPLPDAIESVTVEIARDIWTCTPYTQPAPTTGQAASHQFVYTHPGPGPTDPKVYLQAAEAQTIAKRAVRLAGMDIFQRQDAKATVWIERNRHLVPGRETASAFVYETADVTFPSPLYPSVEADVPVDISRLGAKAPVDRTLTGHLTELFSQLLARNSQPELTFQVEVTYRYLLNEQLVSIDLPILLQPPLTVDVASGAQGPDSLATMIENWSLAIGSWFADQVPRCGGALWFDLATMSNLTANPMPLLRLPELFLPIATVVPALPCRSAS